VPTFPDPIPWVSRRCSDLLNRDGRANIGMEALNWRTSVVTEHAVANVRGDAPQRA
jgi:hypothetical protein